MEYVLLVAMKRRDEIVAQEVTPANRALTPQAILAFVQILGTVFLLLLGLFMLKLRFVEWWDNLGHGERNGQESTKHTLDEETLAFFLLCLLDLLLELFKRLRFATVCSTVLIPDLLLAVPAPHHRDPPLYDRLDQAETLANDNRCNDVIEDYQVAQNGNDLEGAIEGLAEDVSCRANVLL